MKHDWSRYSNNAELTELLGHAPRVTVLGNREEILRLAMNGNRDTFEVTYRVGNEDILEATVSRCRNGLSINYPENYMRRRDSDCMVIGDNEETDKVRFDSMFHVSFDEIRRLTFEWLKQQELAVLPIMIGGRETGYYGLLVAPVNTGFFIGGLADLQGVVPVEDIDKYQLRSIIYLAPPFRHTHFNGKQVVVHNRINGLHEIFSYNLYPGPSAKKGVYGVLLQIGEQEKWLTLHGSTVQVVTPYENVTTILHEGASGSGKSEMLEYPHRQSDGRLLVARNPITGKKVDIGINRGCLLKPVTDDMALCPPGIRSENRKLTVTDAEQAWFIRVNHITRYGTDPHLEELCTHPPEPLIFLNMNATPGATCLIWEHDEDEPGKRCPNPRVILPRRLVPDIVEGRVEVDYRSFGIRVPMCTRENPSYGIFGLMHILPPSLAWLWRLVSPRGDANPSIVDSQGLSSEGVGSYWPFATGRYTVHADLLLEQIIRTSGTRQLLFPNQHIGCWKVGFMPQWVSREYIARRGSARFNREQLLPARCALLGYVPFSIELEGYRIPEWLIEVNKQAEIGDDGYDSGAGILYEYFRKELGKFDRPEISKLGRDIITCCLDGGTVDDFLSLTPIDL